MSAVNRGKQFEARIKEAFERVENCSVDRLLDPQAGYAGIRNICDFIVYKEPNEYYIECKSHQGNTLPFTCITDNQWQGLLEKSKIKGVHAGVIVWFIDHDKTFYCDIRKLEELKSKGNKSINIKETQMFIELSGKKKRILFDYDMNKFFEQIRRTL